MKTITLETPIEVNGETITEVTIRRMKGRDIKKMSKAPGDEVAKMFAILPDLTEQAPEAFDEMDAADLAEIMDFIDGCTQKKKAANV